MFSRVSDLLDFSNDVVENINIKLSVVIHLFFCVVNRGCVVVYSDMQCEAVCVTVESHHRNVKLVFIKVSVSYQLRAEGRVAAGEDFLFSF